MFHRVQLCLEELCGLSLVLLVLSTGANDLCQLCNCQKNYIDCSSRGLNKIPSPANGRLIGKLLS